MRDLGFRSAAQCFGLSIPAAVMDRMLTECRRANGIETGGIVVGEYSEECDCALVTAISGAPADSQAGRTWFYRGVRGLQTWLDRLWNREQKYFLGEWHFHPYAAPVPSGTDKQQLTQIAQASSYQCPQPILIIVGGDPEGEWSIRSFVFPQGHAIVELYPHTDEADVDLSQ